MWLPRGRKIHTFASSIAAGGPAAGRERRTSPDRGSRPEVSMRDKPDLVERRQKYIRRQIDLDRGAVNVKFRGRRPEGTGPMNRHGMPRLPVGQHEDKNWPVLDLGEQPEIDTRAWTLEVGGLVENPFTLSWEQFLALPQVDDTSDFHCVTTWSRYDNHWRGVRFNTLVELAT